MTIEKAPDLLPYRTRDGSFTLRSEQFGEGYHSVNGAVIESTHVFISAGLDHVIARTPIEGNRRPIEVLEVGLGTGLNMLLTWIRCLEGKCEVNYTALEPFPLPQATLIQLDHCNDLAWPGLKDSFLKKMAGEEKTSDPGDLSFTVRSKPVQELNDPPIYDLVYFDAFGPRTDPGMWTSEVFQRIHQAMRKGAILVTYCAKGEVRRTLGSIGFEVERLKGPPGKREMLRATK